MRAPVVRFFILCNLIVFFMWIFLTGPDNDPEFMIDHFLVSWTGLAEGRIWTLLTSAFSHNLFWHFLMNMFVLNSFGPVVENTIGSRRFFKFFITAGIISSLTHALVSSFLLDKPDLPALGASGAISGIILFFSLLFPRHKILLLGLIPVPAIIGAFLFIGLDLWGLGAQASGGGLPIGHGAHLGGALTGILYYMLFFRRASVDRMI